MLVSALDVVEGQGGGVILYVGERWEADGQEVAGGECDFILTAITRNEREGRVTVPEVEGDEAAVSFSSVEGGVGGEPAVSGSGIATIIGRWRRCWRMMKQRKCSAGTDGPNGQVSQASVAGPVEEKE
jgi:hypothetical protein